MKNEQEELLQQLYEADRAGQRAIASLWPDDQFLFRKNIWTIKRLQWDADRKGLFVTTTEPSGKSYPLTRRDGTVYEHQPCVTFRLDGLMLVTAFLTDEHAEAEQENNVDGMWLR